MVVEWTNYRLFHIYLKYNNPNRARVVCGQAFELKYIFLGEVLENKFSNWDLNPI